MRVCVGGTFNIFHKGHKRLLDKAFEVAGEKGKVYIGLSTGSIIEKKTIPVKSSINGYFIEILQLQ